MTTLCSICAFVQFAVLIVGVPRMLWREKPAGRVGLVWWGGITALIALFSFASGMAALALVRSESNLLHLLLLGVSAMLIAFFFVTRRAQRA